MYRFLSSVSVWMGLYSSAQKPPLIILRVALNGAHRAGWQVTGEVGSCFQGQCCNLQVKRRNSTPVCGAVTCLQCLCIVYILVAMTHSLLICKQPFSVFQPGLCPHAAGGEARACSRAGCLRTRPAVLWNQNFKAGTMLGSPNSLSVRQN